MLILRFIGWVPSADCEALRAGFVHQPANTYSSLGFLVAGAWIIFRAVRKQPGQRGEAAAFGVAIVFAGLGSLVLHGPDPRWGLWFHDLTTLAVLLLVAVLGLGSRLGWPLRQTILIFGAWLTLVSFVLATRPTSTDHIAWLLAPAAVLAQVAAQRATHRGSSAVAWLMAAIALGLAAGAFMAGRAGSAFCHPYTLMQWHAVWHVLAAISAAAFAQAAFDLRPGSHPVGSEPAIGTAQQ